MGTAETQVEAERRRSFGLSCRGYTQLGAKDWLFERLRGLAKLGAIRIWRRTKEDHAKHITISHISFSTNENVKSNKTDWEACRRVLCDWRELARQPAGLGHRFEM